MKNRHLIRRYLLPAACAALQFATLPVLASDVGSESWSAQPAYSASFRQLDRNGDGYLSPAEVARDSKLAQDFAKFDENQDKRLSRDEFAKAQMAQDRQRVSDYAADSLTTARIKAALLKDSQVSALSISVETAQGHVLLSGFVDDERQAQRIRKIVESVEGVKKVRDLLVIRG